MQQLVNWWRQHRWVRLLVQWVLVAVPLLFLLHSLAQNWQAVRQYDWRFDPVKGTLSLFCLLGAFSLLPRATQQTLAGLNHKLPYHAAYRGYFLSQLAKYLPGGLWIVPGRAVALAQAGVDTVTTSVGIVIELYLLVVGGIATFLPYLFYFEAKSFLWIGLVILALLPVMMLVLHSQILYLLLERFWDHKKVQIELTSRRMAKILLIDVLFWVVVGSGFYLLIDSVSPLTITFWLPALAAFSMAWVVGFLAFLTPGGLGVREGALSLLLLPFLPAPVTAVVVLLARLWWTIAELVAIALAGLWQYHHVASVRIREET